MRYLTALLCSIALSACALADDSQQRFVSVTGEGFVEAVPDTLTFSVVARSTDSSLEQAQANTATIINQVLAAARKTGVAEDRIDSSQTQARPEYEWRKQERYYLGQTVIRTVSFRLTDLEQYPALLTRLSELKLNQINSPQLSHSQQEALQMAALKVAIAAGKRKATLMANEVGASLGQALQVSEGRAMQPQPRMMMAEAARADGGQEQGYSYALQRINASVQLRYALNSADAR
ncbi:SIMPL domain-containing protein [Candidatus Litorirhabdus singularis]|nr:SIMPL domain-containing protein [Candidatus Litorirhabdus singularis]